MSKLSLNYDALRNPCVQNLADSIKQLDNAIVIFNSLNIPYDYRYRQTIINVKNSIVSRRKELVNIRNWIINSNNEYTTISNELCGTADKLPKSKFGTRKGL